MFICVCINDFVYVKVYVCVCEFVLVVGYLIIFKIKVYIYVGYLKYFVG